MTRQRLNFVIRGVISAALILLIFRKVDWSALLSVVRNLDYRWAVLASSCTFLLIATLALRWRVFLEQQGIFAPYRTVLSLTWAGQFFNSVLPGSTGGDVIKIMGICGLVPDRKAAAASTVFVDRLSALMALVVLAVTALCIYPKAFLALPLPTLNVGLVILIFALGAIAACGFVWTLHHLTQGSQIHGRIVRTLLAARANLSLRPKVVAAVLLAFVIHLLNFTILFFFARALAIPISYRQILLMMPVILFVVMIPVTINGHGLRELLLITYFTSMGIVIMSQPGIHVRETAIALSLVAVANDLIWALPGGLWYMATSHRRRNLVTP